jgi:hypothetical protein
MPSEVRGGRCKRWHESRSLEGKSVHIRRGCRAPLSKHRSVRSQKTDGLGTLNRAGALATIFNADDIRRVHFDDTCLEDVVGFLGENGSTRPAWYHHTILVYAKRLEIPAHASASLA